MLQGKNRLKKKKDFEKVFKRGVSFKDKSIVLKVAKNKTKEIRLGVVVSQKVSKKAVIRNRVKRRFRETIKANFENIKQGFDIVLIALPGVEKKDFAEIKQTIEILLKKAKLVKI